MAHSSLGLLALAPVGEKANENARCSRLLTQYWGFGHCACPDKHTVDLEGFVRWFEISNVTWPHLHYIRP